MRQRAITTVICSLILAWLGLSASTWGIVVWQTGPTPVPGHARPALLCTYFTGTGTFERGYLYSWNDTLGYARCPLWAPAPVS